MGFLRALLIILLLFLVLRFLGRLLFGWGMSQRENTGNYGSRKPSGGKEGDVYIKYKPEKEGKIIEKDDGEYIKYEDVNDD